MWLSAGSPAGSRIADRAGVSGTGARNWQSSFCGAVAEIVVELTEIDQIWRYIIKLQPPGDRLASQLNGH
jgi:hypothetical protein